jgi:acetyltransferase-like isoleucine patch superfamily enzyme
VVIKAGEINETFWFLLGNHLPRITIFDKYRTFFYKLAGLNVDRDVVIWSGFDVRPIGYCHNIFIKSGTFINQNFRCGGVRNTFIEIGKNCAIGPNVSFECMDHNLRWSNKEKWGANSNPIIISDRVWIGAGSIILGGVRIGSDSVIAAGAVVTKDLPPNHLAGGVPARIIKEIGWKSV